MIKRPTKRHRFTSVKVKVQNEVVGLLDPSKQQTCVKYLLKQPELCPLTQGYMSEVSLHLSLLEVTMEGLKAPLPSGDLQATVKCLYFVVGPNNHNKSFQNYKQFLTEQIYNHGNNRSQNVVQEYQLFLRLAHFPHPKCQG